MSRVTTQNVHLRFALPSDAEAVLGIYAPYVRDTAVTFEYEVPDLSSYTERMERIMVSYPF
ncbi:MAG TPA: GNAT family N-acetyltransferase, partial [Spirochaetia bacterium]|nr:GNAT family N-acetyltransferase [Spirochaetia bacterium]